MNQKVSRIQTSNPLTDDLLLHDVIKNSYSKNKAKNMQGYNLDESLSNHNQQVYNNPTKKIYYYRELELITSQILELTYI